ncbi:MAG: radical SAM protein [Rubrivivax sp.]
MDDAALTELLQHVRGTPPTEAQAAQLMQASRDPAVALKVFAAASDVRDAVLGREFKLCSEVAQITPCLVRPFCKYCTFSPVDGLSTDEVLHGVRLAEATGIENIRLSGGTDVGNDGAGILDLVREVRRHTARPLQLNAGPNYGRETLRQLRDLGVTEVGSSLETINAEVFAKTKPGDSLQARMDTARAIDEVGLGLQSVIMVGLGSSDEDYVRHLYFLKTLEHLTHLPISRFNPFKGTPMSKVPRASPWDAARLCAVARLVLRTPDIRIAAGGGPDDIPLWLMAGGNRITSVFIHQKKTEPDRFTGDNLQVISRRMVDDIEVVNRTAVCRRFAEGMGFTVTPAGAR